MTIRWITPLLGTAPAEVALKDSNLFVIDVRELVDKAGNDLSTVKEKITDGARRLTLGERIVICCDYGISRSNAVAAGIVAVHQNISLDAAIRIVQAATGEFEIKLEPLNAVRRAIGESAQATRSRCTRTLLVTGSSGFIGAAACNSLRRQYEVVAPIREQLDLQRGSTLLGVLARESRVDYIVHLANPRVYTSNAAIGATLTMLRNVLDVCVNDDIPLIYLSNWEVYSGYNGSIQANELTTLNPRGPFGETKYLAEQLIEHVRRTTPLRCGILRCSPVYGGGGSRPKFLRRFAELAAAAQPIVTHRYSTGEPALDLLHIDDCVAALTSAIGQNFCGTANIGTGVLTSTRSVAQLLTNTFESTAKLSYLPIDGSFASIEMDCRYASQVLGWKPRVDFPTGLRRFLSEIYFEAKK
jgi:nucleoside-diphosphate-sugar epimerase